MNENFVCIKVDREERPDLDSFYMQATTAMTGSGGWPMSVFLTPDLQPFYAGTYFPPVRRYNMPAFRDVLLSLARAWQEDKEEIDRVGSQVLEYIQPQTRAGASETPFTRQTLEAAAQSLIDSYDGSNGGWGNAPKFPQPMIIEFLLRRAVSDPDRRDLILKPVAHVLHAMARGGMYDVVGGGFARYSVDNFWHVPHFEKMLYDNAQLALAYLHGYLLSRDENFRRICEETLDFVLGFPRHLGERRGHPPQESRLDRLLFNASFDSNSHAVSNAPMVVKGRELRHRMPNVVLRGASRGAAKRPSER